MTVPSRGFAETEFAARCSAAQTAMANSGIEAMLFASEAEIRYFTGFMTPFWQSPTRPWFLVLPSSGKPVAVIPSIGVPLMQTCYVSEILSWSSPAAEDDGIGLLTSCLHDLVGPGGRLGALMGRETAMRLPMRDLLDLRDRLGGFEWCDVTAAIQQIRMVKSTAEIAKIRHICGIASNVFLSMKDWNLSGMPLAELFRSFKIAALKAGVDEVSYLVGGAGPDGYTDIIAPPGERPLQKGDVLMLDTGCVWDGYFCDFDRNFAIVDACETAKEAHRKLYDATDAAMDILRPGIRACDLYTAMDSIIRPRGDMAGGDDVGRYGHGLGIQLTEPPSHTGWDTTEIKAGMMLTLEPSITYQANDGTDRLMVAEENILVTESGCELLTVRASRELPVIA